MRERDYLLMSDFREAGSVDSQVWFDWKERTVELEHKPAEHLI